MMSKIQMATIDQLSYVIGVKIFCNCLAVHACEYPATGIHGF